GSGNVTPFFSRRIGLDAPVLAGARLSGKIGNDWRIGLMNMTTQKTSFHLARNYTVASVQRKVFARSNVGFIFVNKEYFDEPVDTTLFNRVAGMDYNLSSKDNVWNGNFYYHRSFQPENPEHQFSQGAGIAYNTKNVQLEIMQRSVGENYKAEVGYVQRTGYHFISPEAAYIFVPNKRVTSHGFFVDFRYYFNMDYEKIEHENIYQYNLTFRDRSALSFGYQDNFVHLNQNFDPTHISDGYLQAGTEHNFGGTFVNYESTPKKLFKWEAEVAKGTFYNGKIQYVNGALGYRFQPYVNFVLNFNYTDINLPGDFERANLWLIGPKLDVTFTDDIFLSTFVQYNEQMDNMNLNMRFQWRYQPVSDIYLVYTDNYIPGSWNSRNRALVLKMTYWLN
ncbi:MAG TPA: hypothetical protein VKA10_08830, partial [Prolixibacteraceae bacterium]|nr:hypothetical protein [Prolixibacteraceae bacterium]